MRENFFSNIHEKREQRTLVRLSYSLPFTNHRIVAHIDSIMRPSSCASLFSIAKGTVKVARSFNCGCQAVSTSPQESYPIRHH